MLSTEGVYGARIYPSVNNALISMSNAYTAKSGVDANYNDIAYAFDKINNDAVGTVGNAQQVTLNKKVVYKDKAPCFVSADRAYFKNCRFLVIQAFDIRLH